MYHPLQVLFPETKCSKSCCCTDLPKACVDENIYLSDSWEFSYPFPEQVVTRSQVATHIFSKHAILNTKACYNIRLFCVAESFCYGSL
jgi:hypothetical protein